MKEKRFNQKISCCYLYPITKYGYPPPAENTMLYLEEMRRLGFSTVELEGIREEHLLKVYDKRFEIKNKLEELDLNVSYFCAVLPDLSSLNIEVREHNIKLFEIGCEIASLFNAKGILDNGPIPPYQFEKGIPVIRHYSDETIKNANLPDDFLWNDFYDELVITFRKLCSIAEKYNLTYQLHPATGVITYTAGNFLDFYNAVGKKNLKFNFDTANLFAHKENLVESFKKLIAHIDYIHFSDNGGSKVEHLAVGNGNINIPEFFGLLDKVDYRGDIGIDIGGEESLVVDLDVAYINAAKYLESSWIKNLGMIT